MNVLIVDSKNFGIEHVYQTLVEMGHSVSCYSYDLAGRREDEEFEYRFSRLLSDAAYELVFSFNFFPLLSNLCSRYHIKYISWVYDSPLVALYSCAVINPCNYIFIFDRAQYKELRQAGISTVYHMPLAAGPRKETICMEKKERLRDFHADISFVGSFYNEPVNRLYDKFSGVDEYTKGYLDGIVTAQKEISGAFLLEDLLTETVQKELQRVCPYAANRDGVETAAYMYAHYFLARRVTELERTELLAALAKCFAVTVCSGSDTTSVKNIKNIGTVDYYEEMPYIFEHSKINLNITLRSIRTGIPLRIFDIFSSRGFLITNYQEELFDYFVPDKDFVFYTGTEDLMEKAAFYLKKEELREKIAESAYQKAAKEHSYKRRLEKMLEIAFGI